MKYKKNPETYQLRNSEECVLQPFFFLFKNYSSVGLSFHIVSMKKHYI